jgi:hypothetical protein
MLWTRKKEKWKDAKKQWNRKSDQKKLGVSMAI